MITRETDYAMRLLRSLSDGQQHSTGELAEQSLVPQPFAYKILKKLGKAGFVQMNRGASGGCRLAADLEQANLHQLMEAMGENISLTACMDEKYVCPWRTQNGHCHAHCRLEGIQHNLEQELKSHSLKELLAP